MLLILVLGCPSLTNLWVVKRLLSRFFIQNIYREFYEYLSISKRPQEDGETTWMSCFGTEPRTVEGMEGGGTIQAS